jgi:hypothetical protein
LSDFEALAKTALGTDDPERIAAFKEAVMACMSDDEEGEYDEAGPDSGGDADMAKGKGSGLALLFGGGKK